MYGSHLKSLKMLDCKKCEEQLKRSSIKRPSIKNKLFEITKEFQEF